MQNLGKDPHLDRNYFDANPESDPDLDQHQNGKSDLDPDRHLLIKMMPIHNTEYYIYNTVPAHMIMLYLLYRKIHLKHKTLVSYWRCFDLQSITLLS
jgi:hypothetical protein